MLLLSLAACSFDTRGSGRRDARLAGVDRARGDALDQARAVDLVAGERRADAPARDTLRPDARKPDSRKPDACKPVCAGKACGTTNGCGGTCAAGSGCCTPGCGGAVCGAKDGCGAVCYGDDKDPCTDVPGQTWRCVMSKVHNVPISQVCVVMEWRTYNLNPSNCAACCGALNPIACSQL